MGYIYIIKNNINDKVYIGKTTRDIQTRWKEHLRHYGQGKTILQKAMIKYKIENFYIEEIEECPDEKIDEREQFWVSYFDSFQNGYNLTSGGENSFTKTNKMKLVMELWNNGLTINKIVKETKLNVETVRAYLHKNNVTSKQIKERANIATGKYHSKKVLQYDLDNNFIKEWNSMSEIERELGIRHQNISDACRKKKNHIFGNYIWRCKEEIK